MHRCRLPTSPVLVCIIRCLSDIISNAPLFDVSQSEVLSAAAWSGMPRDGRCCSCPNGGNERLPHDAVAGTVPVRCLTESPRVPQPLLSEFSDALSSLLTCIKVERCPSAWLYHSNRSELGCRERRVVSRVRLRSADPQVPGGAAQCLADKEERRRGGWVGMEDKRILPPLMSILEVSQPKEIDGTFMASDLRLKARVGAPDASHALLCGVVGDSTQDGDDGAHTSSQRIVWQRKYLGQCNVQGLIKRILHWVGASAAEKVCAITVFFCSLLSCVSLVIAEGTRLEGCDCLWGACLRGHMKESAYSAVRKLLARTVGIRAKDLRDNDLYRVLRQAWEHRCKACGNVWDSIGP
mmetsp:Transcript_19700/g.54096  ORF Transcript_19700/g.54096 Transcript_19700/m.54096 type:complete len:352 (+) Transcript_19700:564-1619(+)